MGTGEVVGCPRLVSLFGSDGQFQKKVPEAFEHVHSIAFKWRKWFAW